MTSVNYACDSTELIFAKAEMVLVKKLTDGALVTPTLNLPLHSTGNEAASKLYNLKMHSTGDCTSDFTSHAIQ